MNYRIKIATTIISAAVLMSVFGSVFPKKPRKYLKERFYMLKTVSKPEFDIVVMGDSRVITDVSASIIEDSLENYRCLNFGFGNGGLNSQMFKEATLKFNKTDNQKIIVLGITALTIHEISKGNEQFNMLTTTPKEKKIEQLYFAKLFNYFSSVSPSLLQDNIMGKRKPWDKMIQLYHDNGWAETYTPEPDTLFSIPYYKKDYKKSKVDYQMLKIITDQIKDWDSQGVKVFCFRPPTTIQMKKLEEKMGGYDEQYVASEVVKAGAVWIPFSFKDYSSFDGSHLEKESAIRVSSKIGSVIKKELNSK